jgi:hypothetical protein
MTRPPMLDKARAEALLQRDDVQCESLVFREPVSRNVIAEVVVLADASGCLGWLPLFDVYRPTVPALTLADMVEAAVAHGFPP